MTVRVLISLTLALSLMLSVAAPAADTQGKLDQLNAREKQLIEKLETLRQRERAIEDKLQEIRQRKQKLLGEQEVVKPGAPEATPSAGH